MAIKLRGTHGSVLIYVVVVGLIVLGSGVALLLPLLKADHTKALGAREASASAATPTPTPTPTSTPKPTALSSASASAAPVVYAGYCLNVPVIFYHHIQPMAEAQAQGHGGLTVDSGIFDTQMAYLVSRGYTTVSSTQLANALLTKSGLPGKSIVVSADDGYSDFFTYGYPIIQKYGINVSLAIPTGLISNGAYMSWDQLKQMVGSGKVTLYNHSWSHANLAGVSRDKAQYEVSTAKKQLSENTGSNSNVFYYPYGGVNNTAISVLQENGYAVAFSTLPGTMQCDSFLMSLHRTRIGNSPLSSYGL